MRVGDDASADPQACAAVGDRERPDRDRQLGASAIAVDPSDPNHAYVIFSGYREGDNAANIWETTNGGTFWDNISSNLPNAPLDSVVFDSTDGVVIVSGDLGVFFLRKPQSDPKSTTWMRLGTNLPNTSIQDLKIQASTHTLYAMSFGRGVQTIPLPPQYTFTGFTPPVLICTPRPSLKSARSVEPLKDRTPKSAAVVPPATSPMLIWPPESSLTKFR